MPNVALLFAPAPVGIPINLAKPGLRYRLQVVLVLLLLLVFLLFYLALLAGAVGLMLWAVWPSVVAATKPAETWPGLLFQITLRFSFFAAAAMMFMFLLKGFLKRGKDSADLEVTEESQPEMFQFIRSVCGEIGCPVPTRVYLNHEVNAAVMYRTSILNLIVRPRKSLLIGLGLVNSLNLVEFKALLAHELGHFSQRAMRLNAYVSVAYDLIFNMLNTRDRWDNWVIRGFNTPWVSAFALPLYSSAELTRSALRGIFRVLQPLHMSLRRQMEFHADLVAVSVAGSDAPTHLLLKCNFSQESQLHAIQGLALATEQRLFTRDLFVHQQHSGEFLRAACKNPDLGRPPELPADPSCSVTIFRPGDESTAPVWADHPSNYDREQNAKRRYFRSPQDDRSAWLLFRDQEVLREQVTQQFYRTRLNVEPDEPPQDPASVQAFIDDDQAAATLDSGYQELYGDRYLQIADIDLLVAEAQRQPVWTSELIATAQLKAGTDEIRSWIEGHRHRRREFELLQRIEAGIDKTVGTHFEFRGQVCPVDEADQLLGGVRAELTKDYGWLASLDRDVFLLHDQLARRQGIQEELHNRYRFHAQVQQFHESIWEQRSRMDAVMYFLSGRPELQFEEASWVFQTLREIRGRLEEVQHGASSLSVPALKHMTPGDPLLHYLTREPVLPDLDSFDMALDPEWIGLLRRQLETVSDKLHRVQCKSLSGILAIQEHES